MSTAARGAKMTKASQDEIPHSTVSTRREIVPLGLNAKRVVAKRYSLKDAKGNSLEEWNDIVARVVAHVSGAETDPVSAISFTPP
jgi:ribonucleotide reductase alpha subunit